MIGHTNPSRRFRPTGRGGGARKGKPQSRWPLVFKVVAAALLDRAAGSEEVRVVDRQAFLPLEEFGRQLELALPGWRAVAERYLPGRKTDLLELLYNRDYKGVRYSGTSDRGVGHDPLTRAAASGEHWRRHVPVGSPLHDVYEKLRANRVTTVPRWQQYLVDGEGRLF